MERSANRGFVAFRSDKGVDHAPEPSERRLLRVRECTAQQLARGLPFIALQSKQDGRLVWEILVNGTDAHARSLGHAGGSEALRTFLGQNLNCRLENDADQFRRARLLRLFSRGNLRILATGHTRNRMRITKPDEFVVF